jgi:CHAD domain-containing protein
LERNVSGFTTLTGGVRPSYMASSCAEKMMAKHWSVSHRQSPICVEQACKVLLIETSSILHSLYMPTCRASIWPHRKEHFMTQSECECYYLPTKAADALAKGRIGKLMPVLALDELVAPFTVLDCFDQSLRRSNRLLLEIGTSFALVTSDGAELVQSAKRNGRFVADFHDGPVKRALADLSPLRSLLPIGSGILRRGTLRLLDADKKTHCRAYLHILTGTGGEGAILLRLQGLRGYDRSLAELRKHVKMSGGITVNYGRLFPEIFPAPTAYDAKPEVTVKPDDTAFIAAADIISAYIPVARANEGGIIAEYDTEFLHDYRISLRKIRSVLSLFEGVYAADQTADLKAQFAELMLQTGRLRDLDVYLQQKQQYYDPLPKTLHGGLDTLFNLFAEKRQQEQAKLSHHLASKSYRKQMESLAKLFGKRKKLRRGPTADLRARDYAGDLIWRRYRKICKIADGIGPQTDDAQVHALRIHCKKLRYLMEFFGPIFPKPVFKRLLTPLKQLQDNLGLFSDYSVQQLSLQNFPWGWLGAGDLEAAQSVGALTSVLHRWQFEERAKIVKNFARFNSPATQTAFSDLFHPRKDKK